MNYIKHFPETLKSWGLKYIVFKEEDKIVPTAGVKYDNVKERFEMFINPQFWGSLCDADKKKLMAHEIAHILRGDVFVDARKFNPNLANIAQDSLINTVLKIEKIGDADAWNIERLKSELSPQNAQKLDTPFLLGWRSVYEILENEQNQQLLNMLSDILPSLATEKAKEIIAEGILKSRQQNKSQGTEIEKEIQEALEKLAKNIIQTSQKAGKQAGERGEFTPQTTPNRELLAIIKEIEKIKKGKRYRRKTYRREGVVPEIKGISRIPTLDLLVALDISGSVLGKIEKMGGLVQFLKQKNFNFEFGTFSDTWKVYPNIRFDNLEGFGGGTLVSGLFEYIRKRNPSLTIIITDGELFDFEPKYLSLPHKIVWVFTEEIKKDLLKPKDKAILLK